MTKHKKDGLESKVMRLKVSYDENERYIPFCNYFNHRGFILDEYVCLTRKCHHYKRLYINNGKGVNEI